MTGSTEGYAVDAFGERGSLRRLALPALGSRDVLVRVEAAGVNPIDFKLREGLDPSRALPLVLGQDFAGTVEAAGAGAAELSGRRIFGIAHSGAFAREIVVSADGIVAEVPGGVEAAAAAALPTPGLTALALVERVAHHGARSVAVIGPDGAVGRLVLQIAAAHGIKTLRLRSDDEPPAALANAGLEGVDAASELNRTLMLQPDGMLTLRLLGQVHAAGRRSRSCATRWKSFTRNTTRCPRSR